MNEPYLKGRAIVAEWVERGYRTVEWMYLMAVENMNRPFNHPGQRDYIMGIYDEASFRKEVSK